MENAAGFVQQTCLFSINWPQMLIDVKYAPNGAEN
jgi:hypothetical protein